MFGSRYLSLDANLARRARKDLTAAQLTYAVDLLEELLNRAAPLNSVWRLTLPGVWQAFGRSDVLEQVNLAVRTFVDDAQETRIRARRAGLVGGTRGSYEVTASCMDESPETIGGLLIPEACL